MEWATSTNDPDTLGVDKFNIFIGGLNPDEVTKEGVEAKFSDYGELESVSLINKEEGGESPEGSYYFFMFVYCTALSIQRLLSLKAIKCTNSSNRTIIARAKKCFCFCTIY